MSIHRRISELEHELETLRSQTELTDRQQQLLEVIAAAIARGDSPTIRDIGEATEIVSTNGVVDHLVALERKGYLIRGDDGKSRGIRLTDEGIERARNVRRCPTCRKPMLCHGEALLPVPTGETAIDKIRSVVNGTPIRFADICRATGIRVSSAGTPIKRLVANGEIERVGYGLYRRSTETPSQEGDEVR